VKPQAARIYDIQPKSGVEVYVDLANPYFINNEVQLCKQDYNVNILKHLRE
jgi:hypothetical protein